MKEPKDIERLFQEKLKNLEMTPNPAVWNKLEQSIAAPKKSKKGLIWWFSGTVAALLLIGFFIFQNKKIIKPHTAAKEIIQKKQNDSTFTQKEDIKNPEATFAKNTKETNKNIDNVTQIITEKKDKIASINKKEITPKPQLNIKTNSTQEAGKIANTNTQQNKNTYPNIVDKKPVSETITPKQDLASAVNKEQINIPKTTQKHWSIAPVVSELFYNTLSNKSSVDSRLDNAHKNGENSTSFGLKIAYQASKKWRIQTGIHKISLAQTTENITIASISRTATLANSSHTVQAPNSPNQEISISKEPNTTDLLNNSNNDDNLRQSYGYIEIPIEVNYQLLETNRLQLHVIGGWSSLFLTQNNLQIQNPSYSYSDGEATNLNQVNFSLNIGTAVEYHFSNRWFFNLSPMLKMHTQTFNKNSNKPYLLGISTGINYKF